MKIVYVDCFSGASGDMLLGALVDAGLSLEVLKSEIGKLGLAHYDLEARSIKKKGIGGTQVSVIIDSDHHHHHRHLADIARIIEESTLDDKIKKQSLAIFRRLAEAEAKVHRTPIEEVDFHEVGAMDSIIDVIGTVAGMNAMGIQKVFCSPLHVGTGTVQCAHGTLPVPAPATAELIRGKPVYATGVIGELLTPTGAAVLTTLSSEFGPMPAMTVDCIGYGAGTSELSIPNLLRISVGEAGAQINQCDMEQVAVIETNIDDMNPQFYDYLIEKMLAMQALDVFLTPVHMKKNRIGTLLTILCRPAMVAEFADFVLRETTAIGLRWRIESRIIAKRRIETVNTMYGPINVKLARIGNEIVNVAPEYEDCKRTAMERNVPLKKVVQEVETRKRQRSGS
jgi:uncharacterized protein (TIGR00299 family) protein